MTCPARIQATWRAHRCRILLERARSLPSDVWLHICMYLKGQDSQTRMHRSIVHLVSLRVLRMRFSPPRLAREMFPSTSRMVRAYMFALSRRTILHMRAFALHVLECRHGYYSQQRALVCANIFLEDATNNIPWLSARLPHGCNAQANSE